MFTKLAWNGGSGCCFRSLPLDKSLYSPLWQWDWMAFWSKLSLGNWSHFGRLDWEAGTTGIQLSGRRRRNSVPAAEESVMRGGRETRGEKERAAMCISVLFLVSECMCGGQRPILGIFYWLPPSWLFLFFLLLFFLSLFCLCFWDRFPKLVVWLDWLACKAQRSAFISQTYPYHKGIIADTHLHTWLSTWVLGSKPTSLHLLPHPISHPLGHLPSPPESYKDQLHQRTRKMSQNSNWCAHTKQKDRNASPPSVWQNHSALEGAPYRAQGSVEGTLATTRLCEMCAVLRTLYLYVWRVDNAVLS